MGCNTEQSVGIEKFRRRYLAGKTHASLQKREGDGWVPGRAHRGGPASNQWVGGGWGEVGELPPSAAIGMRLTGEEGRGRYAVLLLCAKSECMWHKPGLMSSLSGVWGVGFIRNQGLQSPDRARGLWGGAWPATAQ